VEEPPVCAICGNAIEAGQAWMAAEHDGERRRIHAGCLYTDERGTEDEWEPQEHAAI
jgi:hypothetical protein